jgi:hypothetical protein
MLSFDFFLHSRSVSRSNKNFGAFGDRGDHKKIPAAFRNRDFYYSSGKGLNIFNPYTNLTNFLNI